MNNPNAAVTAVHSLALAIANQLNDDELAVSAAFLTQLGDTLASIAVCRSLTPTQISEAETNQ